MFEKLLSFTKQASNLPDQPSMSTSELKAYFDAAPEEVRVYLNQLVDGLNSTESGDSGAKNIGVSTIAGLTGNDVQTLLQSLKDKVDTKTSVYPNKPYFNGYRTVYDTTRTIATGLSVPPQTDLIVPMYTVDAENNINYENNIVYVSESGVYQISFDFTWDGPVHPSISELILYRNSNRYRVSGGTQIKSLSGSIVLYANAGDGFYPAIWHDATENKWVGEALFSVIKLG